MWPTTYTNQKVHSKSQHVKNIENVKEITLNSNNIQKKTIESDDFYILVKNRINKTGAILKKTNQ